MPTFKSHRSRWARYNRTDNEEHMTPTPTLREALARIQVLEQQLAKNNPLLEEAADAIDKLEAALAAQAEPSDLTILRGMLKDPVLVHAALMRGQIAKPELRDMLHAYGGDVLAKWDAAPAAVAEAVQRQWQPIETAPKNLELLFWVPVCLGPPLVKQGSWSHYEDGCWTDTDGRVMEASHWLALPDLPAAAIRTPARQGAAESKP